MRAKGQGKVIREHEYARYGNPTQIETERKLAAIEGAERAVLYSSGMAAVLLVIMTYMKPEDISSLQAITRQTRDFDKLLEIYEHSIVDLTAEAIEKR
jgi:cystathionine beta-lyase/cystathionine gamma-synthase